MYQSRSADTERECVCRELMRNAISLAYWYEESRLFYSDIQRGSINTVHFNGSGHEVLLEREYYIYLYN